MNIKLILKSLWIGGTMTIPGVSGGTMAVVTGIYEDLIYAINGLRKERGNEQNLKVHIAFLTQFVIGAGVGFLLFARVVTWLLEQSEIGELTRFFFCGIVLGGIPLLVKKSGIEKVSFSHVVSVVLGAAIVLGLGQIPEGLFVAGSGIAFVFLQLLGGVLIAIALVLPGISVSHMLYILGLYEVVLTRVYELQIWELIPLAVGGILGTFLTTDILEKMLTRYPAQVYMVIVGFVAGSIVTLLPAGGSDLPYVESVIPPVESGMSYIAGITLPLWDVVLAVLGFVAMLWVTKREMV